MSNSKVFYASVTMELLMVCSDFSGKLPKIACFLATFLHECNCADTTNCPTLRLPLTSTYSGSALRLQLSIAPRKTNSRVILKSGVKTWTEAVRVAVIACFIYALNVFFLRTKRSPSLWDKLYLMFRGSVPSRVRNLRKMRNFWANFTDFEPEINTIKCKTEKLKQKT